MTSYIHENGRIDFDERNDFLSFPSTSLLNYRAVSSIVCSTRSKIDYIILFHCAMCPHNGSKNKSRVKVSIRDWRSYGYVHIIVEEIWKIIQQGQYPTPSSIFNWHFMDMKYEQTSSEAANETRTLPRTLRQSRLLDSEGLQARFRFTFLASTILCDEQYSFYCKFGKYSKNTIYFNRNWL